MKMETSRDGDKNECVKNCSMHMHMHRRTSQFLSDQSYVYDYECVGLCAIYATSMIYLSYYDH